MREARFCRLPSETAGARGNGHDDTSHFFLGPTGYELFHRTRQEDHGQGTFRTHCILLRWFFMFLVIAFCIMFIPLSRSAINNFACHEHLWITIKIISQLEKYFPLQWPHDDINQRTDNKPEYYANVTGPCFCYGSNIPYLGHGWYDDPKGTCESENSCRTQGKLPGFVPRGFNVITGPGPTENEMFC